MKRSAGFTLLELLFCMAVIFILAALLFSATSMVRERMNSAKCTSNLRALSAAAISYANEHDGYLWSWKEIGNSKFRMAEDPLSPTQLLKPYTAPSNWICPSSSKSLQKFKNTYTWTIASQYNTKPISSTTSLSSTLMFWDVYQFTLPTMKGATEPLDADGNGAGPSNIAKKYWTPCHDKNTKVMRGYLDGHVEAYVVPK